MSNLPTFRRLCGIPTLRPAAASLAALVVAQPAVALDREARYPAATCAAFFLGRDDFARTSAWLDRNPGDPARAAALRDEAVRLNGGAAPEVDAFVAEEREVLAFLFEAMILDQDEQSRDVHDRLVATCETLADELMAGASGRPLPRQGGSALSEP